MNTIFSLKNFRVFDHKDGATIKFAPLTLLTGCNSSGKSSIAKALLVLKGFFCNMANEKFADCKLDFFGTAKMGRFDIVRNNKSRKGSKIVFAYSIYSEKLDEVVDVELSFVADSKDVLNNGWLSDILIKKTDGVIIFNANINRDKNDNIFLKRKYGSLNIHTNNLDSVKTNFLVYILKKLAIDKMYEAQNKKDSTMSDVKESVNVLLNLLCNLMPSEKFDSFKKELVAESATDQFRMVPEFYKDSPYKRHESLLKDIIKYGTLFPMPIWDTLDGVKKSHVRETLYKLIASAEATNKANGVISDSCYYEYNEFLDQILTSFETSEYDTLLSYFIAEEKSWLTNNSLQRDYSGFGTDLNIYKISDICNYPRVIDEFNCTYWESIPLDDDCNESVKDSRFNPKRFGDLFNIIYLTDVFINKAVGDKHQEYMNNIGDGIWDIEKVHWGFAYFRDFYASIMSEILSPKMFKGLDYIADSFTLPKRLYNIDDTQDSFAQFLFDYVETIRTANEVEVGIKVGDFTNKWIEKLGIGHHITINNTAEGVGLVLKLHKSAGDKIGRALTDEGLGVIKVIGTLLYIETAIYRANDKATTIVIEEPENHLHPKLQSQLAELLTDAYKNYGIQFIVETHSEYMVRKLQTIVARKELTPDEVSLQYFYNPSIELRPKGEPQVKSIPIRKDGVLLEPFGPGFLDEADNLAMDILTIKAMG